MTTKPQHPDSSGFTSEDEIDEVLGSANPNPERIGCPGVEVLAALARRERPIGDPGYEHIVNCSPCYRTFRALQQQGAGVETRGHARSRARWAVVAAAVTVAAVGAWFVVSSQRPQLAPEQVATGVVGPSLPTQLDLRKYGVTRSEVQGTTHPAIDLPRARLDLTILLPVGSEPGSYEVQVLDSDLRSRVSAPGTAEIRNYVTTLQTSIDTGQLASGSYQLAVRRLGESWHMFPIELKP